MRAFGLISYSYYLSHGFVIHCVLWALAGVAVDRSTPLAPAVFLSSFAVTVCAALALFLTIEFPASIRKRIAY